MVWPRPAARHGGRAGAAPFDYGRPARAGVRTTGARTRARYGVCACLEIMPPGPARPPPSGPSFPIAFVASRKNAPGGVAGPASGEEWAARRNAPKPDALWRWRISGLPARAAVCQVRARIERPSNAVGFDPLASFCRPCLPAPPSAAAGAPDCRTAPRSADAALPDAASNGPAPAARRQTRGAGRALQAARASAALVCRAVSEVLPSCTPIARKRPRRPFSRSRRPGKAARPELRRPDFRTADQTAWHGPPGGGWRTRAERRQGRPPGKRPAGRSAFGTL